MVLPFHNPYRQQSDMFCPVFLPVLFQDTYLKEWKELLESMLLPFHHIQNFFLSRSFSRLKHAQFPSFLQMEDKFDIHRSAY